MTGPFKCFFRAEKFTVFKVMSEYCCNFRHVAFLLHRSIIFTTCTTCETDGKEMGTYDLLFFSNESPHAVHPTASSRFFSRRRATSDTMTTNPIDTTSNSHMCDVTL